MDSLGGYLFETEVKYFGFFPSAFVDRIVEGANELIYLSIEKFLAILHASKQSLAIPAARLEEGLLKLLTLWEHCVDRNFDVFELYVLGNIFRFPKIPKPAGSNPATLHADSVDALLWSRTVEWTQVKHQNQELKSLVDQWEQVELYLAGVREQCLELEKSMQENLTLDQVQKLSDQVSAIKNILGRVEIPNPSSVSSTLDPECLSGELARLYQIGTLPNILSLAVSLAKLQSNSETQEFCK